MPLPPVEIQLVRLLLSEAVTTNEGAGGQAVVMAELWAVSDVESQAITPVNARKTCRQMIKMPKSLEVRQFEAVWRPVSRTLQSNAS